MGFRRPSLNVLSCRLSSSLSGSRRPSEKAARGQGRAGMGRKGSKWYETPLDGTDANVYAHEAGHVLGQYDEYPDGATDPSGVQPARARPGNLMSEYKDNFDLFPRHYRWALEFLNEHTDDDPYETISK